MRETKETVEELNSGHKGTRYPVYVRHSTPPRATSQGAKKHRSEDVMRSPWNLFGLSQPCKAQELRTWTQPLRALLASQSRRARQASWCELDRRRAGRGEGCRRAGRGVRRRRCRRCIQADRGERRGRSSRAGRGECCRASRGERHGHGSVGRASRKRIAERDSIERVSRRRIAERSGVKQASRRPIAERGSVERAGRRCITESGSVRRASCGERCR